MIKELKYLFYIIVIFLFVFFVSKYYFSDDYKKKSYRSIGLLDNRINIYSNKLPILKNDTKEIIEFVNITKNKNKKDFHFWKLLESNDK